MATKPVPKLDELVPLKSAFGPNARIAILESLLIEGNAHYVHPRQHPNIKAAIAMYQSGELNGSKVYIAGGKVVTHEDALKGGIPVWIEVSAILSLSLERSLTDDLGRPISPIYPKSQICFRPRIGWARCKNLIFFSLIASLSPFLDLNRMPPTNRLRRSRLDDKGTGITRHGIECLILVS